MKKISNEEIAHILQETALLYEMEDVAFKPRAYEKAALGVLSLSESVVSLYKGDGVKALEDIPGVGKGIAEHIEALLLGKEFKEYKRLKKKIPANVEELTAVEGVGPQTVKVLWEKLKVKNIDDLLKAAKSGKISALPGFGKKTEKKILEGIAFVKSSGGRRVLGLIASEIQEIKASVKKIHGVEKAIVAGSVRRWKETIGDIDLLVVSKTPSETMDAFVALPFVEHVYGKGRTKTNVRLTNGLDADMRIVPERSWGAALNYFTGSKAHNIALRKIALKKKYKLNEYGLFKETRKQRIKKTKKQENKETKSEWDFLAGKTEEELYKKLGLRYIEPELREMTGEIEAARDNKLPELVEYGDIRGDLQIQTTWTDGSDTISDYADAAEERGLQYIVITDHTKSLAMTGGADEKKLRRQMKEIDKINEKRKKRGKELTILKGAEVNIMKDGTLDIVDETLAELDFVGAAVHSHFSLSESEQTERIVRAMKNPHVDCIFHLTTRVLNRRKGIDIDIDEIVSAAKKTGTIIEIDAYPDRSDISPQIIKKCVEAGVKMSIDTDAHSTEHLSYMEYGVHLARRGWAEKKDIVNTLSLAQFLAMFKDGKRQPRRRGQTSLARSI